MRLQLHHSTLGTKRPQNAFVTLDLSVKCAENVL
jgi:hypothetical protein